MSSRPVGGEDIKKKCPRDVEALLREYPQVPHVRIADGRGKELGRFFRVKLWPTLIFLRDGKAVAQLVRPTSDEARQAMEQLLAS